MNNSKVGRLQGKVAVVTGAGRGVGRSIALALAAEGAKVVLAARSGDALEHVAAEITAGGGEAFVQPTDVTHQGDVDALRSAAYDRFGTVSVLVNNAGANLADRFVDIDVSEFERLIAVNYISVVRMTKAFLPEMLAVGIGSIVNIASTAGKSGTALQTPYNASKHAVVGLTKSLGIELGTTGVRVNAICPGFVETDMVAEALPKFANAMGVDIDQARAGLLSRVPIGRMLQPEEIGHLAVYLGSEESAGMTGQSLTISGGMTVA